MSSLENANKDQAQPKTSGELVPSIENLVFEDNVQLLSPSDYVTYQRADGIPEDISGLIRPAVTSKEETTNTINLKATIAMGRGGFVEKSFTFQGKPYYFLQWKGRGKGNQYDFHKKNRERSGVQLDEIETLAPEGNPFPLFRAQAKGLDTTRFAGGSNFRNLRREAVSSERIQALTGNELRTPPVLATFAFSRQYATEHGLPLPSENGPFSGENTQAYRDRNHIETAGSFGSEKYDSIILGENIRAFKNPWRVDDIEKTLANPDTEQRQQHLRVIFDTSKRVFEQEFQTKFNELGVLKKMTELLAQQTVVLLENNINQGYMAHHKQDISMAGEICDLDGARLLNTEYFDEDLKNLPERFGWILKDDTLTTNAIKREVWKAEEEAELFAQVLKIGAHLKPILAAVKELDPSAKVTEDELAAYFVQLIKQQPQWQQGLAARFDRVLQRDKEQPVMFQYLSKAGMASHYGEQAAKNFDYYDGYFNKILVELSEEPSS